MANGLFGLRPFYDELQPGGIFNRTPLPGNDLPQQGGITGRVFPGPVVNNPTVPPPPTSLPASPGIGAGNYPDIEEYRRELRTQPQRKDYQLNKWGKLLSGVAGVAEGYNRNSVAQGINIGLGLIDRPYAQAQEDWRNRVGGKGQLADIEVKLEDIKRKGEIDRYKILNDQWELWLKGQKFPKELSQMDATLAKTRKETQDVGLTTNVIDGRVVVTDRLGNKVTPLAQIGETSAQAREENFRTDLKRYEAQHANALDLENTRHLNDQILINLRADAEEEFIRLRDKLGRDMMGKLDAGDQRTAFETAVSKVHTQYPLLVNELFDATGNLKRDKDGKLIINPTVYDWYKKAIEAETSNLLGGFSSPQEKEAAGVTPTGPIGSTGATSGAPEVTDDIAKKFIQQRYPNNSELLNDPVSIQRAKDYIKANPGVLDAVPHTPGANVKPIVTPPPVRVTPQTVPPVTLPDQGQFAPAPGGGVQLARPGVAGIPLFGNPYPVWPPGPESSMPWPERRSTR